MNKLTKEKRNQLILIVLATVGVIAALWFLAIAAQQAKISEINRKIEDTTKDIDKMQQVKKASGKIAAQLAECQSRLARIEGTMPSGDWYQWVNSTIRQFNVPKYGVDVPVIGPPVGSTMNMIPNFPYNQLSVTLSGTAYYDDLGLFLADFENRFPCMRIENLNLEPGGGSTAEDREKLNFRMEVVSLTRTDSQ
jgi:Tfp pilus assembly protein PilO